MQEMIATSEIEYPPGKKWMPGDRFEVEAAHVALLEINGRAKLPDVVVDSVGLDIAIGLKVVEQTDAAPRRGPGRPPKAR